MSTLGGLRLLQADMNSPMGERILIFATDLILNGISVAAINILLMDGTFKVAPPQFMQLWIIRVQFERSHIPVLLPDRAAVAQHQMPPAPSISSPLRRRESITMGLQDCLPPARIQGCNFHFNQLQLKQFRIISDYHSNKVLRIHLQGVYGPPFIPLTNVIDACTELKAVIWTCCPTQAMSKYITYFEKNWIFSSSCSVFTLALELLCSHLGRGPRTDNAGERGNNALKHATTSNNPCIWSFVPTIRALNSEMEQKLLLLWQNIDPERPGDLDGALERKQLKDWWKPTTQLTR